MSDAREVVQKQPTQSPAQRDAEFSEIAQKLRESCKVVEMMFKELVLSFQPSLAQIAFVQAHKDFRDGVGNGDQLLDAAEEFFGKGVPYAMIKEEVDEWRRVNECKRSLHNSCHPTR